MVRVMVSLPEYTVLYMTTVVGTHILTCTHTNTHSLHTTVKRRTPSPARNPPSRILHVEHLTRPFTIMQLKELLTEDGPMISEGFWTNKIKSHCIILVGVVSLLEYNVLNIRDFNG